MKNLYILVIEFFKNVFRKSKLTLANLIAPDLTTEITNAHVVRNSLGRPIFIKIMVNGNWKIEAFTESLDNELKGILSNQLYTTDELIAENYIDFYNENESIVNAIKRKYSSKVINKNKI